MTQGDWSSKLVEQPDYEQVFAQVVKPQEDMDEEEYE